MRIRTLGLTTLAAAAVTAGALLTTSATHADPLPQEKESRVEQLSLGEHWFGPDITKDDLVGKVVLVEIWGS